MREEGPQQLTVVERRARAGRWAWEPWAVVVAVGCYGVAVGVAGTGVEVVVEVVAGVVVGVEARVEGIAVFGILALTCDDQLFL